MSLDNLTDRDFLIFVETNLIQNDRSYASISPYKRDSTLSSKHSGDLCITSGMELRIVVFYGTFNMFII